VTREGDVALGEGQRGSACDIELQGHQVEAGHLLGDRVLDLQPGVHLQEEELAVLDKELAGAGADVADLAGELHGRGCHGGAQFGVDE
jgi:hypothetical protein